MLATLAGVLALVLGLSLLLLPLLVQELSRPRDSFWGAVVLLLGLVLVTSAERLTGAPMLAVLCGGLLVGRLGTEVAQARWRVLSDEERLALLSVERWNRSLNQLAVIVAGLLQSAVALASGLSAWLAERRQGRSHGKRWVRSAAAGAQEDSAAAASPVAAAAEPAATAQSPSAAGAEPMPEAPGGQGVESATEPPSPADADAAEPEAVVLPAADRGDAEPEADSSVHGTVDPAQMSAQQSPESDGDDPGVRVVSGFEEIDTLLERAGVSGASEAGSTTVTGD